VLTFALLSAAPASAVSHVYSIEILDRQPAKYQIQFEVEHPGRLSIEAVWSGKRMLGLRLDPPGEQPVRRTGFSPLRLDLDVDPASVAEGAWILGVHAVPTRGSGEGTVTIEFPKPPGVPPATAGDPVTNAVADEAPTAEQRTSDPWRLPREAPSDLPLSWERLFEATERFRALIVDGPAGSPADACRWQDDLLRYLAESRDRLVDRKVEPPAASVKLLKRLATAIRRVEAFRTSKDPVLAGPPPEDAALREAWLRLRRERTQQLEAELDELLLSIQRSHAPELDSFEWPARIVTCLVACQRHFEERSRRGEAHAVNRDLARAQWVVLLVAGEALQDLTQLDAPTVSPVSAAF
jgi:hypothetical protein